MKTSSDVRGEDSDVRGENSDVRGEDSDVRGEDSDVRGEDSDDTANNRRYPRSEAASQTWLAQTGPRQRWWF